jgi:phosphoenolpyruvate synthase/pyruvate phosphate dikinase
VYEGVAIVVSDTTQLPSIKKGDVLVVPSTSSSINYAFALVSAIVADEGGLLSHAAILSREFGIPCVVGTGNGTQILKTGDKVVVDGTNGTVKIVK